MVYLLRTHKLSIEPVYRMTSQTFTKNQYNLSQITVIINIIIDNNSNIKLTQAIQLLIKINLSCNILIMFIYITNYRKTGCFNEYTPS